MKESCFFIKNEITLHYTKSGEGEKNIFLFHGSGQTENAFNTIRTAFEKEYTVYCFDLFFHGQSSWLNSPLFTKENWVSFFTDFLLEKAIDQFSILSFSLGTRFGLSLYETLSNKIENIWLIAPEGLKIHWVYSLATGTVFTRWIFQHVIEHPEYLLKIVLLLKQLNLVPPKGYQFLEKFLSVKERRLQFYKTWIVFRKLNFDTNKVVEIANNQNTQITILASEKDYIIPFVTVKRFFEKIKNGKIEVYQIDHFKLLNEVAKHLDS